MAVEFVEHYALGYGMSDEHFARLCEESRTDLLRYCARRLKCPHDAEDAVQVALMRAWRSRATYSGDRPFWPWLATIAHRACQDHRKPSLRALPSSRATSAEPAPGERLEQEVDQAAVRVAFARLPDSERRMVGLRDLGGLSYGEIASVEGTSIESVRGRLRRARVRLRDSYVAVANGVGSFVPTAGLMGWLRRTKAAATGAARQVAATPGQDRWSELAAMVAVSIALLAGSAPVAASGRPSVTTEVAAPQPPAAAGHASDAGSRGLVSSPANASNPPPGAAAGSGIPEGVDGVHITSFASSERGTLIASGTSETCDQPPCAVIFSSADNGASWVRLTAAGYRGGSILVPPDYESDLHLYASSSFGLQISRDAGDLFAPASPVGGDAALSPRYGEGDRRILLGAAPGWAFDTDSGLTTPLGLAPPLAAVHNWLAPLPSPGGGSDLLVGSIGAIAPSQPRPVVMRCVGGTCQVTAELDGGALTTPRVWLSSEPGTAGLTFAWAGDGLWRSSDSGRTFERAVLPGEGLVQSMAEQGGAIFVAMSGLDTGGLFVSYDQGGAWERLGDGTGLDRGVESVIALPGSRLIAALSHSAGGGLTCSSDGGATWAPRCASSAG